MTAVNKPLVFGGTLGGSPLSRAAQAGTLPGWYRSAPKSDAAWTTYGADVASSVQAEWFDALRSAIVPTGAAAARLERSAGGKGIVVTTGQQPGLFGGPLMSLIKAISARALADEIERATGMPVAPIFWAATDDADFDEAAVVSVALDGGARELRMDPHAAPGTPMSRVPLGEEMAELASRLREACGSSSHRSYLDSVLESYRSGTTVGDAYVAVLRRVLEPLAISVLDVSHPSVASAAAPLMRRAVDNAPAIAAAVRRRNEAIVAAGFTPQVDEVPGLSLVFLNTNSVKRRLSLPDASALGALADNQFLSSTVLLRPVLERAILPTAAYVGGPGEIAYFAQLTAVAEALDVPTPLVVPRWSATILEPRIQRVLDALGVSADELAKPDAVETRVAREHISPAALKALAELRASVESGVDGLRAAAGELVPAPVLDGLHRSLEHRLARAERRLVAGVKRRETELMRAVATARGSLYPYGTPQERKLAYIPFLARYGPELVNDLLDGARAHARLIVGSELAAATVTTTASATA